MKGIYKPHADIPLWNVAFANACLGRGRMGGVFEEGEEGGGGLLEKGEERGAAWGGRGDRLRRGRGGRGDWKSLME